LTLAAMLSGGVSLAAQEQSRATATPVPAAKQGSSQGSAADPAVSDSSAASSSSSSQVPSPRTLPVNIDQIRRQLQQQPAVRLDDQQLRFYVLVLGKEPPKFMDFIGDYDLRNGPTKGGAPMTHQEFLSMVTPKELNELMGSTSSSAFAMAQAAVMNAAVQTLLKKGLEEMRQAYDEHERQAIRDRIDRELAALLSKGQ
jgi:hypothetical protein